MGSDRDPDPAVVGAAGAAQGDRLGRHGRVPRRARGFARVLVSLSLAQIDLAWVGALLAGGVVAAPIAAWLVKRLPPRILGSAVSSVILVTNAKRFAAAIGVEGRVVAAAYIALAILTVISVWSALAIHRRERQLEARPGVAVL